MALQPYHFFVDVTLLGEDGHLLMEAGLIDHHALGQFPNPLGEALAIFLHHRRRSPGYIFEETGDHLHPGRQVPAQSLPFSFPHGGESVHGLQQHPLQPRPQGRQILLRLPGDIKVPESCHHLQGHFSRKVQLRLDPGQKGVILTHQRKV